jgi:predicted nucleic acid-binding protein
MKFLLDTDTCVFWLRGRASVRDNLVAVGPEATALSVITLASCATEQPVRIGQPTIIRR